MVIESWESDEANLDAPLFAQGFFSGACEWHAQKRSPLSSWLSPGYGT